MKKSDSIVKPKKEELDVLTAQEVKQLDDAVEFINNKANSTARSLLEIGNYLLEHFFDGDPVNVAEKANKKGISLRKLAAHNEINLSFMSLSNAVKLAVQENLFAEPKYKPLTETHKLMLFSLQNDDDKVAYADKVIESSLSVRALKNLLIEKDLIKQRGRIAGSESGKNLLIDPLDRFFKPLETLADFELDFEKIGNLELSDERVTMLKNLKEQIEKLLSKVAE